MHGLYPAQSRPYLAEASNFTNESFYGAPVPIRFGQNNLLVSHGQQRNIHDTTNMSIMGQNPYCALPQPITAYSHYFPLGQPQPGLLPQQQQQQQFISPPAPLASYMFPYYQPSPVMRPGLQPCHSCTCCPQQLTTNPFQQNFGLPMMHRQITPDGVDFSFGYSPLTYMPMQYSNPFGQTDVLQTQFDQLNLQQHIALKQLEKHSLETMLLQEQLKRNPFLLQFHHDKLTSTDDLFPSNDQRSISQAMPDMQAAAAQCFLNDNVDVLNPNVRQLRLTKSPDLQYSSNPAQTQPRPYSNPSAKSCVSSKTEVSKDNENANSKVTFEQQQSADDMHDALESQFEESKDEGPNRQFTVEKPTLNKAKKVQKGSDYSESSVKYSVEEPITHGSSDDETYSTNSKSSKGSGSEEEIAYKRLGDKYSHSRSKRRHTKKQPKKKVN